MKMKKDPSPGRLCPSRPLAILASGYWHCTTPAAFRLIAREGAILPNLGRFAVRSGVTPASHCYRTGGVSLFEPASRGNLLAAWLAVHQPITIAIRLDPRKVAQRAREHDELRRRRGGVLLRGEVCHPGPIPLDWCTGCLLTAAKTGEMRWLEIADPRAVAAAVRELKAAARQAPARKPACPAKENVPAAAGFRMPAEWAPHRRCWMAWPTRRRWRSGYREATAALAGLARTIARFEPVTMLAHPLQVDEAAVACGSGVEVMPMLLDDLWIRDTGPSFLLNAGGALAGTAWSFNAWGRKHRRFANDAALAWRLLASQGVRSFRASLVNEGGAISIDGDGTLLTTESVLLNRNRNPWLTKEEIEQHLCACTGATKVVWLPGSTADPVTDGHVDGLAVFAAPGVVLAEICDDVRDPEYEILRENLRALRGATDASGRSFDIRTLSRPPWRAHWPADFAASYLNFYVANGAVIIPRFGRRAADAAAAETIGKAFPGREIVAVDIEAIAGHGGGIHCVTQQQPAPRR
ncbi:MAG TPA: agmatine deiminase family protein [Chthoniobacteraceae bacterium]|jgi:agmatine deiminase|nr:agmatine deiminase family protein [Chthoniobacteraceae bacterium]